MCDVTATTNGSFLIESAILIPANFRQFPNNKLALLSFSVPFVVPLLLLLCQRENCDKLNNIQFRQINKRMNEGKNAIKTFSNVSKGRNLITIE